MKFFIVTPCRNAARYLPETVESILNQTAVLRGEVELEYWIQDGASTDETTEVAARYGDKVHFDSVADRGMYDALAKRLRTADADVVAYLNAGDYYFPTAFEILADIFPQEDVDWVTGYSCLINEASQFTAAWKPPRYRRRFVHNGTYLRGLPFPGIQQESTFWSGRANATIHFDQLAEWKLAGDYFLWTELAKHFELHSVMGLLGAFRQHDGQLSEQVGAYRAEIERVLREAMTQEKLTAYWEYQCNPLWKKYLWNFILRPSRAKIFEYEHSQKAWMPR